MRSGKRALVEAWVLGPLDRESWTAAIDLCGKQCGLIDRRHPRPTTFGVIPPSPFLVTTPAPSQVYRIDLESVDGFSASFASFGATLLSLRAGDKAGNVEEVGA